MHSMTTTHSSPPAKCMRTKMCSVLSLHNPTIIHDFMIYDLRKFSTFIINTKHMGSINCEISDCWLIKGVKSVWLILLCALNVHVHIFFYRNSYEISNFISFLRSYFSAKKFVRVYSMTCYCPSLRNYLVIFSSLSFLFLMKSKIIKRLMVIIDLAPVICENIFTFFLYIVWFFIDDKKWNEMNFKRLFLLTFLNFLNIYFFSSSCYSHMQLNVSWYYKWDRNDDESKVSKMHF